VADVEHRAVGLALALEVRQAGRLGDEEPVGDGVGDEAVDLLGHGHVAAAQAGLHMGHRDAQLLGHDGAGQRGVDVAHHQGGGGAGLLAELLVGDHDLGGLLGVAAAAAAQAHVGLRDAEFLEEHVVHLAVVVLAGVHQAEGQTPVGTQRAHQRGDLHEVGPRAGHQIEEGFFAHGRHCDVDNARLVPGAPP
jgi:hypothetical protein